MRKRSLIDNGWGYTHWDPRNSSWYGSNVSALIDLEREVLRLQFQAQQELGGLPEFTPEDYRLLIEETALLFIS